jgi:hypothetical protein
MISKLKLTIPHPSSEQSLNEMLYMIETKINELVGTVDRLEMENVILKSRLGTVGADFRLVRELDGTYRLYFSSSVVDSTYHNTPMLCEYVDNVAETMEAL